MLIHVGNNDNVRYNNMKNLTVEQKIEKLEKKAFEIKLKIDDLKHEQELDEKRKSFLFNHGVRRKTQSI